MTSAFDSILLWTEGQNEWRPAKNAMDKRGRRGGQKKKKKEGRNERFCSQLRTRGCGKDEPHSMVGGGCGLPNDDKGCLTTLELLVSPLAPLPNAVFRTLLGASQSLQEMLGISRP